MSSEYPYKGLPDCAICKSALVKDIEKDYRKKPKILPLAVKYGPLMGTVVSTLRAQLQKHINFEHRKYRIAEKIRELQIVGDLEDRGVNIDFDSYRNKALKKAFLHLEDPMVKVTPKDVAVLENVTINKAKVGLDAKTLELRMASLYGGFLQGKAVEVEVVKDDNKQVDAGGVRPESTG